VRILVCASAAPLPPFTGLTLVLEALLEQLRSRHEIRMVALRLPGQSGDSPPGTRFLPSGSDGTLARSARAVTSFLTGRPLFFAQGVSDIRRAFDEELAGFDPEVVHVTSGRLAELGRALGPIPSVVAPLDAAHLGIAARAAASRLPKRTLLRLEERRVRRFEAEEYERFDRVVVVSDQDRTALERLNPRLRVVVIPNGVDPGRFAPDPSVPPDRRRIVFTGVMSSPANVVAAEFLARAVLPEVRRSCPDARLALVGRAPPERVGALAALAGVEVTGEVPDVRPWLAGSRVFACPMQTGTGIKNKLLEAMAAGLPCVATTMALGGLGVSPGREILVADTAEDLAAEIVRVLDDDGLAERLGRAARAYVVAHHSWEAVARAYERVYEEIASGRAGPPPSP
jgi:glycosyltransferase involved in cell wall biosynthesis